MLFKSRLLPFDPSQSRQILGAPVQVLQGDAQGIHTPATLVVPSGQVLIHLFYHRFLLTDVWSQLVQLDFYPQHPRQG